MQAKQLPFEVSASSLLPPPFGEWIRPLEPALLRLLLPDEFLRSYAAARNDGQTAAEFVAGMLENLDIRYRVQDSDLERIPSSGSVLIAANHPFGILEGLILVDLLEKVRSDYRIVANSLLAATPALRQRVFFVNPFGDSAAPQENGRSLRASLAWLGSGGLLVMFPAGEVAHLNWGEKPVTDPKWNTASARFARKTGCTTVPLFFDGANSLPFQMMGAIHPRLRTLNLPRELIKMRRRTIDVRIGRPIAASVLQSYPDAESATEYLRARTYLLLNRPATLWPAPEQGPIARKNNLAASPGQDLLAREVDALGPECVLAANDEFSVLLASASEIPGVLHEIGRAREMTYREIGEGTGRSLDLDEFDSYYQHMFLWNSRDRRVAGAYRLAATQDVLPRRGVAGLYTSTLFHYEPAFFERIGPAIELGRSFICREYQKTYAPLLLLWKGIAAYVLRRPECAVLFGAVSISSDYHSLSRTLIVNYLQGRLANELSRWVRPRRAFRGHAMLPKHVKQLSRLLVSVEELSASIQDLERDGKGLPVLMRQYLKVGGQILGFNVDPHFSNALDALVLADLRNAAPPVLDRYMGRAGAASFAALHAAHRSSL
ncbi:MAG TPA: GNAT family N-acyltransferase [Bryobacteraceae bacterium]|jgi:putative hemolysin